MLWSFRVHPRQRAHPVTNRPGPNGRTAESRTLAQMNVPITENTLMNPPNYLEIAGFLCRLGTDSISVNSDSVPKTMKIVHEAEQMIRLKRRV
jgi:hypothetical protein